MTAPIVLTAHTPQGTQTISIDEPDQLVDVLRRAGLPLNTRCGRRGLCDGCLIQLISGELTNATTGQTVGTGTLAQESRSIRACEHHVSAEGDVEIRVSARSLLAHEAEVVTSFRCNVSRADEPLWQRAKLDDSLAPAVSFSGEVRIDAELVPLAEPGLDVAAEFRGDHWLIRPMPATTETNPLGVAIDLGTTTVVGLLVDLATGRVLSKASALNGQVHLGDNVLTRINLCLTDEHRVHTLRKAVVAKTLAPLLEELLTEADAFADDIVSLTVAGNTTMLHLLAGVNPGSMGMAPFTPTFLEHRMLPLAELPVRWIHRTRQPEAPSSATVGRGFGVTPTVHLLPGSAAYVGADISAGVLASGMAYRPGTSLLVDIGTNGEIVLNHAEHLVGCATAAGPAFEGSGLTSGMRAATGAIGHLTLHEDSGRTDVDVLGGGKPIGLCGTAYIDFLAQARRLGLIDGRGRITDRATDAGLVRHLDPGRGFEIARGQGAEPIVISEADIASLLQAKAAIAAGVLCLLRRFELESRDVETVYLAGGFGFHMNLEHLIGCGLLPGFEPAQIEVVGNTSLAGAYLALLDATALSALGRISQSIEIAELNLEPDFETLYIDQLWLP